MRISQSGSRLVITETPFVLWAFGLVFVVSGCFVLTVPLWAAEWAGFGGWERLGVLTIGLGHLAGGLFTAWQPRATRTEIDRATDRGTVTSRRLLAMQGGVRSEFKPSAARAVELVASTDSDGDRVFRLRIRLSRSEMVWLQAQAMHGEAYLRARAERIADFLGVGPPLVGVEAGAPPRIARTRVAEPAGQGRDGSTRRQAPGRAGAARERDGRSG